MNYRLEDVVNDNDAMMTTTLTTNHGHNLSARCVLVSAKSCPTTRKEESLRSEEPVCRIPTEMTLATFGDKGASNRRTGDACQMYREIHRRLRRFDNFASS